MLSGWEALPKSLGTYSADIDKLFWDITGLMTFSWVLSTIVMVYLFGAFARKEGVKSKYLTGDGGKQLMLIYVPLAVFVMFDMYIDVSTAAVWKNVKTHLPKADVKVHAIAQQWAWTFVHEGNISTVNELHVPAGRVVHVELESSDVVHSFSIPIFRLKQDVIPGRIITSWFQSKDFATIKAEKAALVSRYNAGKGMGPTVEPSEDEEGTATFDLQCTEMCGVGHGIMAARIIIHNAESYARWVASETGELHEFEEGHEQDDAETETAAPMESDAGAAEEAAPAHH
jgi:cytochrome c oxidase subunit 2